MIVCNFVAIFQKIFHHQAHKNSQQRRGEQDKERHQEDISFGMKFIHGLSQMENKGLESHLEVRRTVVEEG